MQDTLRPPPPAPARPAPVPVEQAEPAPARGPVSGERTLVVQSFSFTGNTVIPETELQARVAPHLGKQLTIGELFDIADGLTAFYRERGYGLANVVLPAQRVDSGTIRFEVVEGRVGKVYVEGNQAYEERALLKTLRGLEVGKVLESAALEREVLLLNDRPGLDARAVIQPGAEYGTSDIVIKVTETPYEFKAALDNHGREAIGEHRLSFDAAVNSLSGRGDRLAFSLVYAQDGLLKYYNLAYGAPINARGGTLTVSANRADYEVEDPAFAGLGDITGDNANYRVDLGWPLTRTRFANTVLNAALVQSSTDSDTLGIASSTSLSYLEASAFWNRIDPADYSSWTLSAGFAGNGKGQDVVTSGLTPDADGIDPESMKARLKLDGSFAQPFARSWAFLTRGSLQWSPDPLPDTQKFAIGGPYVLRGYQSSEQRGDQGATLSLEVQHQFRAGGYPFLVSGIVEGGWVDSEDVIANGTPVAGASETLMSAGVGLIWNSDGPYTAQLSHACPIGSYESPTDDGCRLWATVSVKF